ncbi:MAG: ParB/RepB/Spo0J family partition protein [Pseudomonadota bacterium]
MAGKRKGLGTGLDALLSGEARRKPAAAGAAESSATVGLKELPVDLLERGEMQPRVDMRPEALQELADSIKSQGIAQPILVRPKSGGKYEIVAGERRWRAAQLAGLDKVPAVVRDLDDTQATALALIENMQREDLNPMEESRGLYKLKQKTECTHQELAEMVGRSRASVSNLMRLMELELDVQKMLESRELEMGHARALLGLSGRQQLRAARDVVAGGLSVRATERLVQSLTKPEAAKSPARTVDNDVRRLENELSEKLGTRVTFQQGAGGKGKLLINYNSLEELEGILAHIK